MKTVFLLIFLWTLAYAYPVSNRLSAHPRSSTEREDTASEDHMNELVGLDDGDDRSPRGSRERGEMDVVGDLDDHDPADDNDFGEEIARHDSGAERSRIREAQHKNWVDHEDASNLDEAEDQHENSLGQHLHEKHFLEEEDVHDADNGGTGEDYGAGSRGSDSHKVGGNGPLYRPTGFFPRGGYRERSDLLDEEDDSGDDTFDENNEGEENGQDPTYTTGPNEAGERDTFGDNDHNGDHRDTMVSRRQHDSSSSSSESRSLDHREYRNYIASRYGGTYRRGGDSDSSSQEERYDFDNEEMQGDDPSVFDGFMSNSKGLRATFRYRESSQESSREAEKALLEVSDQSEEESHSDELPDGPDDSEDHDSLHHEDSKSKSVEDASREDSQAAEDESESEEHVTSESKENSADRSEEDTDSQSREDVDSKSREELASQSDEANRESQEENSREELSKSNERSVSESQEGQEDRESAEDESKLSEHDSESAEHESESAEKSQSSEDSVESEEDGTDSVPDDDAASHSKSTESQSTSHEGDSSEEDPTTDSHESEEVPDEDSTSTESHGSDSKEEEHSHSAEEDSHSREDATNESTSHGDDSLPRSLESEKRKRRLRVYHKQHIGDYDDNDCQDGY